MIFASLVIEREPMRWQDFPGALLSWVQVVGGFAAVALVLWGLFRWVRRAPLAGSLPQPAWQRLALRWSVIGAIAGYVLFAILMMPQWLGEFLSWLEGEPSTLTAWGSGDLHKLCLFLGGICAIAGVALPFLADAGRLRWRRMWALARLSFKEAVRRRVLWVFSALTLIFLFASWFLNPKPEDQVRTYVEVVYTAMTLLLLATASLLAAFSIPADVKNQTIHTIVTKPVERFEIVFGRFLGYTLLMAIVLAVMTGVSLLYLIREVDQDAAFESMRARVPVFGNLEFRKVDRRTSEETGIPGENVGREWEYRRYIAGGPATPQRAVWVYDGLPAGLANRSSDTVSCEFSFDIFRTLSLRAEEGKGVLCSFSFETRRFNPKDKAAYDQARDKARRFLRNADGRTGIEQATRELLDRAPSESEIQALLGDRTEKAKEKLIGKLLIEKFGLYEIPSMVVVDYHTQSLEVPTALFRVALEDAQKRTPSPDGSKDTGILKVVVKCDSGGQYLGVAKRDFYILNSEGRFAWNFIKGSLGLLMRLCLVMGLAVACSTYLSGVIGLLCTWFLFIAGFFQETIRSLVENKSPGGGPMESFVRLVNREALTTTLTTPGAQLAQGTDDVYRLLMRCVLYVLPDVDQFDWKSYVAEGFNIGMLDMVLINFIMLVGYLLPWALLAYYLMKSREVAS
jgi:hypothetical protein